MMGKMQLFKLIWWNNMIMPVLCLILPFVLLCVADVWIEIYFALGFSISATILFICYLRSTLQFRQAIKREENTRWDDNEDEKDFYYSMREKEAV